MARTPFVCGNWKMFTSAQSGRDLAAAVAKGVSDDRVRVAVCPPYPYLVLVADVLQGSRVALGAQNLYPAKEGAFTGEVSPVMLKDVGCEYVIVGHSERRHVLCEQDAFINHKVKAGMEVGLMVILGVGETLEERNAGATESVLRRQLLEGLKGVSPERAVQLVLAYEPVWAIGTGINATPEQAQEAHAFLRRLFADRFGRDAAERLVIQYGGSVRPDNAAALLSQPDVDGSLVGGASLKADSFLAIVRAAAAAA
jgi:triosephosphate isomerase (TIM)